MAKFRESTDVRAPKWGRGYQSPAGGIAFAGSSPFRHRFGGESWSVVDPQPIFSGPTLLLTFDLSDPILSGLDGLPLKELPLCSYVSCVLDLEPQFFRLEPRKRRVVLLQRPEPIEDYELPMPRQPFAEKPLRIEPMTKADYPTSEKAYWRICDMLLGGGRFIRVLGPPLWLDTPLTVKCTCGQPMRHVCTLGYETHPPYSGLFPNEAFMLGEMGLYWMLCERCLIYGMIPQST